MTSTDYARQIADRLGYYKLFPDAPCQPAAAVFDLETDRLVGCYLDALEREHPGVTRHMVRWEPRVVAALGMGR